MLNVSLSPVGATVGAVTTFNGLTIVAARDDLYDEEPVELADIPALRIAVRELKRLVNDPIALLDRAKGLLEGTAPRLLAIVSPVLLIASALGGTDWPGSWDDALRGYLLSRPSA